MLFIPVMAFSASLVFSVTWSFRNIWFAAKDTFIAIVLLSIWWI